MWYEHDDKLIDLSKVLYIEKDAFSDNVLVLDCVHKDIALYYNSSEEKIKEYKKIKKILEGKN